MQSRVPGPAKSTRTPEHALPVSGAGPLTLRAGTARLATTGPSRWENGRDAVSTPASPQLRGQKAADVWTTNAAVLGPSTANRRGRRAQASHGASYGFPCFACSGMFRAWGPCRTGHRASEMTSPTSSDSAPGDALR